MDAARGCGDSPPCPGFKDGGACPTEEVLSASCLLHDGTGIQSSHLFVINNRLKALEEDEGREEMFMKHLFTMLLALVATTASAQDFEVDGICYNILSQDDRTVEVTESHYEYAGDVVIPAEVTYDGSTYSVTTIGENAFYYCDDLKSISMPSVTTIGDRAFYGCDALTSVEMPSVKTIGDYAFVSCSALTSVSMPLVKTINAFAFSSCSALTSIEMPSVTTIGEYAFDSCSALTSVEMPSVKTIGLWAFCDCNALTSVSMPQVTTIGECVFYGLGSLTSVSMPAAITIGDNAFFSCRALTSVSMPSVKTIGEGAFYDCSALTSVDIPASVSMIGNYAFSLCNALTSVYCHWEDPLECDPRFENTVLETATLYVPTGTIDAYRSVSPWSGFINIVERDYSGIADATAPEVVIKVIDGAIVIEGGDMAVSAPVVEVYSAGGVCVYRGTDSSIGGLGRGVYVVRVGDAVHKVAL